MPVWQVAKSVPKCWCPYLRYFFIVLIFLKVKARGRDTKKGILFPLVHSSDGCHSWFWAVESRSREFHLVLLHIQEVMVQILGDCFNVFSRRLAGSSSEVEEIGLELAPIQNAHVTGSRNTNPITFLK